MKPAVLRGLTIPSLVAPCVGAWIETSLLMTLYRTVTGRTLRGCVD